MRQRKNTMYRKLFIFIIVLFIHCAAVSAAAVGTWKVYRSYSPIEEIAPAGNLVFVKANGNLYSYNTSDKALTTYAKEDGLWGSAINHIKWVPTTKKLIIVYDDYTIELLSANGDVETIVALREKRMTTDKTVYSIYIDKQYAYLCTAFGLMKIDTRECLVEDTYSIGIAAIQMTISNGKIYIASDAGPLYEAPTDANLIDKNTWTESEANWDEIKTVLENDRNDYGQIVYDSHCKCYWGSNAEGRLTQYDKTDDGYTAIGDGVIPDGPKYPEHMVVRMYNGKLHTLRGFYNMDGLGKGWEGVVQTFDGQDWSIFDNSMAEENEYNHNDYNCMAQDPLNKNHIMVGGATALFGYTDGKMTERYTGKHTKTAEGTNAMVWSETAAITGLAYDKKGNLWVMNMQNPAPLVCYTKDKEWKTFSPPTLKAKGKAILYVSPFFDSRGLMWFCYNHYLGNFFGFYNPETDETSLIDNFTNQDGKNINPANTWDSRVVTEDMEGNVWLGTNHYTIYVTPDDIKYMLSHSNDLTSLRVTQHKVPRNDGTGLADYLLDGISVRDIKVDAANRKWIATDANGVYLISSDNNTELEHFTTDNSLLPSNKVCSICIDDKNGRVYFGTLNGLCSYETGMTEDYGTLDKANIYAYPNPVRPEYTGDITIKGLIENAQIKITTSSGYVVHEGVSNGNIYKWNGCDQQGERVTSGVYMVLVTTPTGEEGCVTKIAMVK